jgi:hypothetical protein
MGGCCCRRKNDRSDEDDYLPDKGRNSRNFGHGDALGMVDLEKGELTSASKDEKKRIRYALESNAKRKFAPLRVAIALYIFLLIIMFIAGALVGYYYKGALGDQVILLFMAYYVGGAYYAPYRSTANGVTYAFVISRIIGIVVGVLFYLVYIGLRILFVVNCNNPSYLAQHPYESIVCTDSYGASIGVIVLAGVVEIFFITFIILEARVVRPAEKLRDFIAKKNKNKLKPI